MKSFLDPAMGNRHGLIAGATVTGKTVSLQVIAERFSAIGVPVFMADVKRDLSGISQPGSPKPKIVDRIKQLRLGGRQPDTIVEAKAKSALRAASSQIGRQIVRGVLGSIFGGRR